MRDFLLNNSPLVMWVLVIVEVLIGVLSLNARKGTLSYIVAAESFGLAVDALIQAIGVILGEGTLLQSISQIRYILHGLLVPLMVPIAFYTLGMKKELTKKLVIFVTVVLMGLGIYMGMVTKTEPVFMAGVLRYASSKATPAFARTFDKVLSIGGVIPLIAVGLVHVIKNKSAFLLLSGVAMFGFAALAPATHNMDLNFVITMIGEVLMIIFFYVEVLLKKN